MTSTIAPISQQHDVTQIPPSTEDRRVVSYEPSFCVNADRLENLFLEARGVIVVASVDSKCAEKEPDV